MSDTILCILVMALAAFFGFLAGAFLNNAFGGAILFALIAGVACIIHAIKSENKQ